jgi:hypothetical protein
MRYKRPVYEVRPQRARCESGFADDGERVGCPRDAGALGLRAGTGCTGAQNQREENMGNKLFVGGLAWATSDESLRDAFSKFGEVTEAKVITDRETGRSRGFGFVSFAEDGNAAEAVAALDGSELDGRTIRVNEAQDRARSGGGGGGGGYGGGGGGRGGGGGGYGGGGGGRGGGGGGYGGGGGGRGGGGGYGGGGGGGGRGGGRGGGGGYGGGGGGGDRW